MRPLTMLGQFSSELDDRSAAPRRPDLRIYRVGNQWFAFALESEVIDYRVDEKLRIRQVPVMAELVVPLARLMDHLDLEFGAVRMVLADEAPPTTSAV